MIGTYSDKDTNTDACTCTPTQANTVRHRQIDTYTYRAIKTEAQADRESNAYKNSSKL